MRGGPYFPFGPRTDSYLCADFIAEFTCATPGTWPA